jgi:hypothetical protein
MFVVSIGHELGVEEQFVASNTSGVSSGCTVSISTHVNGFA